MNIKNKIKKKMMHQRFWNHCFDKGRLKNFVLWFFSNYGEHKTVELLENLKNIGFEFATKAGISLGIDDLKIPPKKIFLMAEAEKLTKTTINQYKRGEITGVERFQRLIDTWHRTSESLKQEVIEHFQTTDILNPIYMMAFSGARGNISQVRQLVGMRGLMADPQGQILDFPIRSNFREGLTLTEYIISCYGARKGIVDTALRTANAGYLTRRLVDVAQHVIVSHFDCGTKRGIILTDMKEGHKTIYSLANRLVGRVLAKDVHLNFERNSEQVKSSKDLLNFVGFRNQEISSTKALDLAKNQQRIFVRSPLTCQSHPLICQLCYGWSLAQGNLVSIGEAVGIIAAQSIGEPGTQLTMRTFHTGGVFSGDITEQIRAPFDGVAIFPRSIPGTLIRTSDGKIAFLTKSDGIIKVGTKFYKIPSFTVLFVRNGEKVFFKQVIAQISNISKNQFKKNDTERCINAEIDGEVYFSNLKMKELLSVLKKGEDFIKLSQETPGLETQFFRKPDKKLEKEIKEAIKKGPEGPKKTEIWTTGYLLSGQIYKSPIPANFFVKEGDFIGKMKTKRIFDSSKIQAIKWSNPKKTSTSLDFMQNSITIFQAKDIVIRNTFLKQNFSRNEIFFQHLGGDRWIDHFSVKLIQQNKIESSFFQDFKKIFGKKYKRFSDSVNIKKAAQTSLELPFLCQKITIPQETSGSLLLFLRFISLKIQNFHYKKNGYIFRSLNKDLFFTRNSFFLSKSVFENFSQSSTTELCHPKSTQLYRNKMILVEREYRKTRTRESSKIGKKNKLNSKVLQNLGNFWTTANNSRKTQTQFFLEWFPTNLQTKSSGLVFYSSKLSMTPIFQKESWSMKFDQFKSSKGMTTFLKKYSRNFKNSLLWIPEQLYKISNKIGKNVWVYGRSIQIHNEQIIFINRQGHKKYDKKKRENKLELQIRKEKDPIRYFSSSIYPHFTLLMTCQNIQMMQFALFLKTSSTVQYPKVPTVQLQKFVTSFLKKKSQKKMNDFHFFRSDISNGFPLKNLRIKLSNQPYKSTLQISTQSIWTTQEYNKLLYTYNINMGICNSPNKQNSERLHTTVEAFISKNMISHFIIPTFLEIAFRYFWLNHKAYKLTSKKVIPPIKSSIMFTESSSINGNGKKKTTLKQYSMFKFLTKSGMLYNKFFGKKKVNTKLPMGETHDNLSTKWKFLKIKKENEQEKMPTVFQQIPGRETFSLNMTKSITNTITTQIKKKTSWSYVNLLSSFSPNFHKKSMTESIRTSNECFEYYKKLENNSVLFNCKQILNSGNKFIINQHRKLIFPGKKFLNDIKFDKNILYVECKSVSENNKPSQINLAKKLTTVIQETPGPCIQKLYSKNKIIHPESSGSILLKNDVTYSKKFLNLEHTLLSFETKLHSSEVRLDSIKWYKNKNCRFEPLQHLISFLTNCFENVFSYRIPVIQQHQKHSLNSSEVLLNDWHHLAVSPMTEYTLFNRSFRMDSVKHLVGDGMAVYNSSFLKNIFVFDSLIEYTRENSYKKFVRILLTKTYKQSFESFVNFKKYHNPQKRKNYLVGSKIIWDETSNNIKSSITAVVKKKTSRLFHFPQNFQLIRSLQKNNVTNCTVLQKLTIQKYKRTTVGFILPDGRMDTRIQISLNSCNFTALVQQTLGQRFQKRLSKVSKNRVHLTTGVLNIKMTAQGLEVSSLDNHYKQRNQKMSKILKWILVDSISLFLSKVSLKRSEICWTTLKLDQEKYMFVRGLNGLRHQYLSIPVPIILSDYAEFLSIYSTKSFFDIRNKKNSFVQWPNGHCNISKKYLFYFKKKNQQSLLAFFSLYKKNNKVFQETSEKDIVPFSLLYREIMLIKMIFIKSNSKKFVDKTQNSFEQMYNDLIADWPLDLRFVESKIKQKPDLINNSDKFYYYNLLNNDMYSRSNSIFSLKSFNLNLFFLKNPSLNISKLIVENSNFALQTTQPLLIHSSQFVQGISECVIYFRKNFQFENVLFTSNISGPFLRVQSPTFIQQTPGHCHKFQSFFKSLSYKKFEQSTVMQSIPGRLKIFPRFCLDFYFKNSHIFLPFKEIEMPLTTQPRKKMSTVQASVEKLDLYSIFHKNNSNNIKTSTFLNVKKESDKSTKFLNEFALARTLFCSPFEGEILKITKNKCLILTKSDQISFYHITKTKIQTPRRSYFDEIDSKLTTSKMTDHSQQQKKEKQKVSQNINRDDYRTMINPLLHVSTEKNKKIQHFKMLDFFIGPPKALNSNAIKLNKEINSQQDSFEINLGDFLVYGDILKQKIESSNKLLIMIDPPIREDRSDSEMYATENPQLDNWSKAPNENKVGLKIPGQVIHLNKNKITLRRLQPLFLSPNAILHSFNGDFVEKNKPLMTLPFQVLTTGDIVQGIPKIEQLFEARTTKNGRFFKESIPNLLIALFQRYKIRLPVDQAVRQSFYKIQQIIIDGVQRVYRSQGVTIGDKHIEIIVKQMTSKVLVVKSGQSGFLPGEILDLEFVEKINDSLINKIRYEPIILGITKASLEVDSFLSAASFQQTTKVLSRSAIIKKRDFLKGLKENVIIGNLIPAGTGFMK